MLIWPVTRRLGVAYGALVAINLAVPLALGGAISIGRLTATMFPLFLWLAAAIPERRLGVWVLLFAVGQGLMAVLFYTWRPPDRRRWTAHARRLAAARRLRWLVRM